MECRENSRMGVFLVYMAGCLPMQATCVPSALFVYPVLHVQSTALLPVSCEQVAFESHSPLLTRHESTHLKYRIMSNTLFSWFEACTLTGACGIRGWTSVGIASLASAHDSIAWSVMCADGILVTSTILHLAAVWKPRKDRQYWTSGKGLSTWENHLSHIPVHVKPAPEAVFVNPVLHAHTTPLFIVSCEQLALAPHPPLFTWQESTNIRLDRCEERVVTMEQELRKVPVQTTLDPLPVFE